MSSPRLTTYTALRGVGDAPRDTNKAS